MSNRPHITPTEKVVDPIDKLNAENDRRRAALRQTRGIDLQVVELLLGVILEEFGDEARLKYAERLKAVLDSIEEQHARMTLLGR